jgi:acylphosphatase
MSQGGTPTDRAVIVRRRVRVWGSVQGVFFRATCAREASRRGVAGWVNNLPDGSVEAVFEGEAPAVEAMTIWCRRGPDGAQVDGVESSDQPSEGLEGFRISG